MVEHSFRNVTEELRGSGLIDLMYPQYQVLLTRMAEMADACGGREFPATHAQIAKRSGGYHHGSITSELVSELVFDFIRIRRMQDNDDAPPLPPVVPQSSPMRTLR